MPKGRLNKLDRMSAVEDLASGIEDNYSESLSELGEALATIAEQANQIAEAAAEAMGWHEERDWESRDSSLESMGEAIAEFDTAIDNALGLIDVLDPEMIKEFLSNARVRHTEMQDHADNVIGV